jgi:catechol 2,3-dioxygenase-like lactoylglutathione lyase family enzyme
MLGRFLEVSVNAPDVLDSIDFYRRLGFSEATVGETWSHPYGVVTDGRLAIGLHTLEFASPALTFVKPDLRPHLARLEQLGIEPAFQKLGDEEFNEIGFTDPGGQMLTLLEARTFSPPDRDENQASLCGYFSEFGVPQADFAAAVRFWDQLGFVATEESQEPFVRISLTSDHLDVGLYRPADFSKPVLLFVDSDLPLRLDRIRAAGIEPESRLPSALDPATSAMFIAPEGTQLVLMAQEN